MGHTIANIFGSLIAVAAITTLILPGRQTPAVINAAGNATSTAIKAAIGQG